MNKPLIRRKSQAIITTTNQLQRKQSKSNIHNHQKLKNKNKNYLNQGVNVYHMNAVNSLSKIKKIKNVNHQVNNQKSPNWKNHPFEQFQQRLKTDDQNFNTINIPQKQMKKVGSKSNLQTNKSSSKILAKKSHQKNSLIRSKSQSKITNINIDSLQYKRKSLSPYISQNNTNFISINSEIRKSNETSQEQKNIKIKALLYKSQQGKNQSAQLFKKKKKFSNQIKPISQQKTVNNLKKKSQNSSKEKNKVTNKCDGTYNKKSLAGTVHDIPLYLIKQLDNKNKIGQIYSISQMIQSKIKVKKEKKTNSKQAQTLKSLNPTKPKSKSKNKIKKVPLQPQVKKVQYSQISFEEFILNKSGSRNFQSINIQKVKTDVDYEQQLRNINENALREAQIYQQFKQNLSNRLKKSSKIRSSEQRSSKQNSSGFTDSFDHQKFTRIDKKWINNLSPSKQNSFQKSSKIYMNCQKQKTIEKINQPVTFTNQNSNVSIFEKDHAFKIGIQKSNQFSQNQSSEDQKNEDSQQQKDIQDSPENEENSLVTIQDFNSYKKQNELKKEKKIIDPNKPVVSTYEYQEESFLIQQKERQQSQKSKQIKLVEKENNIQLSSLIKELLMSQSLNTEIKDKIKKVLGNNTQMISSKKSEKNQQEILQKSSKSQKNNSSAEINKIQNKTDIQAIPFSKPKSKRISLQIQIVKPQIQQSPIQKVNNFTNSSQKQQLLSEKKKQYIQKKVQSEINSQKFFNSPKKNQLSNIKSPINRNLLQSPRCFSSPRQRHDKPCSPSNKNRQFFFLKEDGLMQNSKQRSSQKKNKKLMQEHKFESPNQKSSKVQKILNSAQQQLKLSEIKQNEDRLDTNVQYEPYSQFSKFNVTSQLIQEFGVRIFRYIKSNWSSFPIDQEHNIYYPFVFKFLEKILNLKYYQEQLKLQQINQVIKNKPQSNIALQKYQQQFLLKITQAPLMIFDEQMIQNLMNFSQIIDLFKNQGYRKLIQETQITKKRQSIEYGYLSMIMDCFSQAINKYVLSIGNIFNKIQDAIDVQKFMSYLLTQQISLDNQNGNPDNLQAPKLALNIFMAIFVNILQKVKAWGQTLAGAKPQLQQFEQHIRQQLLKQIQQIEKKQALQFVLENINDNKSIDKFSDLMLSIISQSIYNQQMDNVVKQINSFQK